MKRVLLCLLASLSLTGCELLPFPRELEDTMLVQVLGVDWTDQNVTLTAAGDPTAGSTGAVVLTASGRSLEQAKTALKGSGEQSVSLTHVTQLVLGAESDLFAVLEAALAEPALGQGATVWLTQRGRAEELLAGVGGGAKRLTSIELNGGAVPVTVLQALMRLEEEGQVELPVLGQEGEWLVLVGTQTRRRGDHGA